MRLHRILFLSLMMSAFSSPTHAGITAEAYVGQPYGVGRITIVAPKSAYPEELGVDGVAVSDAEGRILYPAIAKPADMTLVKDLLRNTPLMRGGPIREEAGGLIMGLLEGPPKVTLYFLFEGARPMQVQLSLRENVMLQVTPRNLPALHRAAFAQWWKTYSEEPSGLFASFRQSCPPVVKNYLTATLARKLNLPLPPTKEDGSWQETLAHELGLTLGTEEILVKMEQARLLGDPSYAEKAELTLPELTEVPLETLPAADEVRTETIAGRVPEDAMYIRFGSFANFLWFQDFMQRFGGDFANLVALRGLNRDTTRLVEDQLIVKQDALSRMLGGTLISDVAIVADDLFQQEGAAMGLLFEARNEFLLKSNFEGKRSERLNQGGVKEEKVDIEGRSISFIHSPHSRARSYFAVDKGYLFVTNSHELMRRFLLTGKGEGSLGESDAFRYARSVMPLDREDTVFFYLSEPFFRRLTGGHYRIEMVRRLQAAADIELVEIARTAATGREQPADSVQALIDGGFLPPDFGPRPDGSQTLIEDGRALDSVRGYRGTFVPVPDVAVKEVTASELRDYEAFREFYQSNWDGRMDPVSVGIRRQPLDDRTERMVLDVRACPLSPSHKARLSQVLGAPNKERLTPMPGDIMAGEVELAWQRLFGGIQDVGMPFDVQGGRFVPSGGLTNLVVGYVGTTGQLGFLGLLNTFVATEGRPGGLLGGENGLRRYESPQFTVFSFQPHILARIESELTFKETERPAQARLFVGDVSKAEITPALNAMGFLRTRDTSLGNVRFLQSLHQQLRLPVDKCLESAERILAARLVCPLSGGTYEVAKTPAGEAYWTSAGLQDFPQGDLPRLQAPPDKQAPPLNWFRGLDLDALMQENTLSLHVELDMKLIDVEKGLENEGEE